jgi:NAD+ synthase
MTLILFGGGVRIILNKLLDQDYANISKIIERFILKYTADNSAKGVVIGLSGGLDSSVVLQLCINALGSKKVLGLIMPSDTTPKEDIKHAIDLVKALELERYHMINILPILQKYTKILQATEENKRARGNLMARIRMNLLYYYAGINSYIVAGTSDKSELKIGYFTKFGDGAADILPIADLYKTQVRALAKKHLQIPAEIIEKKSSPRLWDEHLAEKEIGMDYETMDPILYCLLERKMSPAAIAKKLEYSIDDIYKVKKMVDSSLHKREMPKIAYIMRQK